MADLAPTVAEIKPTGANAVITSAIAGATLTAGQVVYIDPADNKAKLASAAALGTARAKGITLHAALANQPVDIQTDGDLEWGTTTPPVTGVAYLLSGTAGGISPHLDATTPASAEYLTVIGVMAGTGVIRLCICASDHATA
jgi:hypothetical protein